MSDRVRVLGGGDRSAVWLAGYAAGLEASDDGARAAAVDGHDVDGGEWLRGYRAGRIAAEHGGPHRWAEIRRTVESAGPPGVGGCGDDLDS